MDYFTFYGLEPVFHLDLNELRKRYYQKSREVHPDMNTPGQTAGGEAVDDPMYWTALNNQAYQILQHPVTRLKYLIERYSGPIPEQQHKLSSEFLTSMMEFHEAFHEARMDPSSGKLEALKQQLADQEMQSWNDFDHILLAFDAGDRSPEIMDELTYLFFKQKYFKRLRETAEGGEEL
ncbi:MAG TPA: iron-sulfur cluster co-chaperone HscB C-terminal domain-containing protein [Saprospiraceae bacterium]|nr:iron-sulfur cluster co-chaperone HscB C-terminal domain-containing protein [Saprospiraceae bacterium]